MPHVMKRNHENNLKQELRWIGPPIPMQTLRDETDDLALLKDAHAGLLRAVTWHATGPNPKPIECTSATFWWDWEEDELFHTLQMCVKNHDEVLLHVSIEINEEKNYDEEAYYPFTYMMDAILEVYAPTTNVRILRNNSEFFEELFFDWEYIGNNVMPLLENVDFVEVDGGRDDEDLTLYKGMLCNDLKKFSICDGYTYGAFLLEVLEVGWRSPSLKNIHIEQLEWKDFVVWCEIDVVFNHVINSLQNSKYIGEFVEGKVLCMPGDSIKWRLVREMNCMPTSIPKPSPLNLDYYTGHEMFSSHQVLRWLHILSCIAVVLKLYVMTPDASNHLQVLCKLEMLFQVATDTFDTYDNSDFIFTEDDLELSDAVTICNC
jgi:hypothetical protein